MSNAAHVHSSATERRGVPNVLPQNTDRPVAIEHRILRRPEVEAKTGFKRAHIYALMKDGKFPKALRLGVRAVGWDSAEVDQWIRERLLDRA
jgi:prophage regulatory protein